MEENESWRKIEGEVAVIIYIFFVPLHLFPHLSEILRAGQEQGGQSDEGRFLLEPKSLRIDHGRAFVSVFWATCVVKSVVAHLLSTCFP